MDLRIGTSGFGYQDWHGPFYPRNLPASGRFAYYSRIFNTVEINSTFYRHPSPRMLESLAERAPAGFDFTVKAHQELTHAGPPDRAALRRLPQVARPLSEAGRLGAILIQFPFAFRPEPSADDRLKRLADELAGLPVVVEFRHRLWQAPESWTRLRELGLGACCVDLPRLPGLPVPEAVVTSPIAYFRLHGRNAAQWWEHQQPFERYDYLYSQDELAGWKGPIQEAAARAERTYVYFNNHYQGKAGHNARQMADLLGVTLGAPLQGSLFPALED